LWAVECAVEAAVARDLVAEVLAEVEVDFFAFGIAPYAVDVAADLEGKGRALRGADGRIARRS